MSIPAHLALRRVASVLLLGVAIGLASRPAQAASPASHPIEMAMAIEVGDRGTAKPRRNGGRTRANNQRQARGNASGDEATKTFTSAHAHQGHTADPPPPTPLTSSRSCQSGAGKGSGKGRGAGTFQPLGSDCANGKWAIPGPTDVPLRPDPTP